jgi:hypothetical protein
MMHDGTLIDGIYLAYCMMLMYMVDVCGCCAWWAHFGT